MGWVKWVEIIDWLFLSSAQVGAIMGESIWIGLFQVFLR